MPTFTAKLPSGKTTDVPAFVTCGLAVHRSLSRDDRWSISAVNVGMAFPVELKTEKTAKRLATDINRSCARHGVSMEDVLQSDDYFAFPLECRQEINVLLERA